MSQESEQSKKLKEELKEMFPKLLANIMEEEKFWQMAEKMAEDGLKDKKSISNEEWGNATPEQMRMKFLHIMKFISHLWGKVLRNEHMTLIHSAFVFGIYDESSPESEKSQILTMRKELEELKEFHKYVLETVANKQTHKTTFEDIMYA